MKSQLLPTRQISIEACGLIGDQGAGKEESDRKKLGEAVHELRWIFCLELVTPMGLITPLSWAGEKAHPGRPINMIAPYGQGGKS